jgi:rhamnosyltransferase subunit B
LLSEKSKGRSNEKVQANESICYNLIAPKMSRLLTVPKRRHIVFATIGSSGDLNPCFALAQELQRRGHAVTIAATEFYRVMVEQQGIAFHALRPDWNPTDQELIRQCENLRTGPRVLFRKLILPHLRHTYEDLLAVSARADLMIAGELVYAAPLVAEKLALRWVSAILSPSSFLSSRDPSVLVTVPGLQFLRKAGWPVYRTGLNICRLATRHWSKPVRRLRREVGLQEKCDPVFRDKFSPDLVLALFSEWLGRPQRDWPAQTVQTGFVFYDRGAEDPDRCARLRKFLASGEPPVVFTLGSTAVHHPGDFYESSAAAAKLLGRRAVLVGPRIAAGFLDPGILALPYLPYSEIFPAAAAIVHQGGSGTTGQALRAGRPMLFTPYGWDQPDNAARVEKLGIGLCLSRKNYSAETAAAALKRLLSEPRFANRAAEIARNLKQEDGLTSACNAIEAVLKRQPAIVN